MQSYGMKVPPYLSTNITTGSKMCARDSALCKLRSAGAATLCLISANEE
jgi:hypothetical protein